mmetsp:Transcript_13877/g.20809  ORF Transcript_13877/g.20809 Transcript_13877/m.20809 type:complete len:90 (-) Transcript_13877:567-836(-)
MIEGDTLFEGNEEGGGTDGCDDGCSECVNVGVTDGMIEGDTLFEGNEEGGGTDGCAEGCGDSDEGLVFAKQTSPQKLRMPKILHKFFLV